MTYITCDEWATQDTLSERSLTEFTATRVAEEPWRISRLKEVFEMAQQICCLVHKRPFPDHVVLRMHDHKGDLIVQFYDQVWEVELREMFGLAWAGVYEATFRTCNMGDGGFMFQEVGA